MEWISVKDRLPEKYRRCIVYLDIMKETLIADFCPGSGGEIGYWRHEEQWIGLFSHHISHWMTLPKSPEDR